MALLAWDALNDVRSCLRWLFNFHYHALLTSNSRRKDLRRASSSGWERRLDWSDGLGESLFTLNKAAWQPRQITTLKPIFEKPWLKSFDVPTAVLFFQCQFSQFWPSTCKIVRQWRNLSKVEKELALARFLMSNRNRISDQIVVGWRLHLLTFCHLIRGISVLKKRDIVHKKFIHKLSLYYTV